MSGPAIEIRLMEDALPALALVAEQEQQLPPGSFGARVDFTGHMRDFNDDRQITGMFLEHYPGMTEKQLQAVCAEAAQRWPVQRIFVAHRVGEIHVADTIVLVSVWSAHRSEAFDACRHIINELKSRAPFWKQEQTAEGRHWVAGNTVDSGSNPS